MTCTCSELPYACKGKYIVRDPYGNRAYLIVDGCIEARSTEYTSKYNPPPPRAYWQRVEGWKQGYDLVRVWKGRWCYVACRAELRGNVRFPKGEREVVRLYGIFGEGIERLLKVRLVGRKFFGWYVDDVQLNPYKFTLPILGKVTSTLDIIVVKVGSPALPPIAGFLAVISRLIAGAVFIVVLVKVIDTVKLYVEAKKASAEAAKRVADIVQDLNERRAKGEISEQEYKEAIDALGTVIKEFDKATGSNLAEKLGLRSSMLWLLVLAGILLILAGGRRK